MNGPIVPWHCIGLEAKETTNSLWAIGWNRQYVPTEENLADVASRGCSPQNIPTNWWSEPKWLQDQNSWPPDMATGPNNETRSEAKVIIEVLLVTVGEDDKQDDLLPKFRLWKTLGIKIWINRFIANCRTSSKERIRGPITTIEINDRNHGECWESWWVICGLWKSNANIESSKKFQRIVWVQRQNPRPLSPIHS